MYQPEEACKGNLLHTYDKSYFARLAQSGDELPLARTVRLHLLKGEKEKSSSPDFNNLLLGFAPFTFNDIGSSHDVENALLSTTYCCEEEHWNDYVCTPNLLTADDPVYQSTGINCMNSTRPLTFQDYKCTREAVPAPLKKATTCYDLSQVYNVYNEGDQVIRSFVKGQLTVEEDDGHVYPPSSPNAFCPFNSEFNSLLSVVLYEIWFVRHHNYLASKLAELNPCWSDEKLFNVARNMNIAYYQQVLLYEWLSALEGRSNLIKAGIINKYDGFRDLYDEDEDPEVTLEYAFAFRWFHLMQPTVAKFYDRHGNFIEDYSLLSTTFHTGFITDGDNIEYLTQSMIRDGCRAYDSTVAYDLVNDPIPGMQERLDVAAGDLNKCRNLGVAPYVDYIKHFTDIDIKSFDDLSAFIPVDKIKLLKYLYGDVKDIDLIVGLWIEKTMEGGHIPPTFANIINDNVMRALKSDRHWYERPNRPDAFTEAQLKEIRKASIARLLCDVGDGISEVPRNAIYNISPENPLVSCGQIMGIDFSAWKDNTCKSS
ncbi:peroxidase-like [Spodoptera litura]|uniref:Peroxidase-like n=1 Tax=Spodoptera litura TaxID=69820 RepID=A0A9J7IVJ0_SPOLT|nr:peroxidase-like [Spodoptera litura]